MRTSVLLVTLLALPAAAVAQAAPAAVPSVAAVRKAIDARNAEWVAAANRGDVKGISKIYDKGAMIIPPEGEPISGTANIEKVFGDLAAVAKNLKFKTTSLDVNGNYAYELGTATYDVADKDGKVTHGADKYLVIWKLGNDGIWYYHIDMWWVPSAHEKKH